MEPNAPACDAAPAMVCSNSEKHNLE